MSERTTVYFRQFDQLFRFFICPTKNFANSQHKKVDHCDIQQFRYHFNNSVDQLPKCIRDTFFKPYTITCLFTCFQLLIRGSSHIVHYSAVK